MDYESRKIKWYWLLLFTAYVAGVVWFLFKGNPFLYSKNELKASLEVGAVSRLQTIPAKPTDIAKISSQTFQPQYNVQRTSQDPQSGPRSKNDLEYQHFPVDFAIPGFTVAHVSSDNSGFYVTGDDPWVAAVDLDGKVRWKFRFQSRADLSPEARAADRPLPVLLDETSAYLVHPNGEVICLDKLTGKLRWLQNLKTGLVANTFLWKRHLVAPVKDGNSSVKLLFVDRSNGTVLENGPDVPLKPGFLISESPDLNLVIATVDNKVIALDPEEDWSEAWSQSVTDPIKGPAVVVGTQVYVATLGAKLIRLDGAKRGKPEWEADLVKPAASSPAYMPLVSRLAVMDVTGAISTVDTKTGKVHWRGGSENRTGLREIWTARLKGAHIEEFHMDWLHKGWTVWAPCADQAFCIYTPNKGELVTKIPLSGKPLSLPLAYDRRWIFLAESKDGHYLVSQVLEEGEIKKLHKAQ